MVILGHPSIGTVQFLREFSVVSGNPEKTGGKFRSVTGPTVHQINTPQESSREIAGAIRLNTINIKTMKSLLTNTSYLLATIQYDNEVYAGYLKSFQNGAKIKFNLYDCSFNFFVTEKLS